MWTEEELPEGDLRSVYGEEAWLTRTNALLERLFQRQVEGIARLDRLRQMHDETTRRLADVYRQLMPPDTPEKHSS